MQHHSNRTMTTSKQPQLRARLQAIGEDHARLSKETDEIRSELHDAARAAYSAGIGSREIAESVGLSRRLIDYIIKGRNQKSERQPQ